MTLEERLVALVQSIGADIKALFGRALPSGGAAGQMLVKSTTTDYAVAWQTPGSAAPNWYGVVYGAWGDCNPQAVINAAALVGSLAATPTAIGTSVARVAYFRPPANITVNKIRFYGVGATTSVYRVAIYNADTLARVTGELAITTAGNAWGSVSAGPVNLTGGQLYFIAVSVNATGNTAGMLCMAPTQAATTGQIAVLPKSWPGSLDVNAGFISSAFAQFAVTTGALPATAATIATQAAWTGGFPALWLDSNNA